LDPLTGSAPLAVTQVSLNEDFRKALVNQTTTIFKQACPNLECECECE